MRASLPQTHSTSSASLNTFAYSRSLGVGKCVLAFSKNKSTVKKISMGVYVTTIEKNAFNGLKNLTTVTLRTDSKSKPRIKAGAFGKLDTKKITINVTGKIKSKALTNLKKDLKTIKFKGTLKVSGKKVTF